MWIGRATVFLGAAKRVVSLACGEALDNEWTLSADALQIGPPGRDANRVVLPHCKALHTRKANPPPPHPPERKKGRRLFSRGLL
jgi:hypothetical protein